MKQLFSKKSEKTIAIVILVVAMVFLLINNIKMNKNRGCLVLTDGKTGKVFAEYPMEEGDEFSIGFIHSVNKSPLTDVYQIRDGKIYVVKTIYYGFGAGVQTYIEEGQTLEYGEDGSMIVTGFEKRMDQLQYIVGTVSDHILTLNDMSEISLRDLCGRNALVRFEYK